MDRDQFKLVFTGDDSLPFQIQRVNSELGSQATFTAVPLDTGVVSIGTYGIALTTQYSSQRIDLPIPDQVFDIGYENSGTFRTTGMRDFRNEFIYFTYTPQERSDVFPTRTLLWNYRDSTWATFDENYTHYGNYRAHTSFTWATLPFRTWESWTLPWNFGGSSANYPNVIGGNQQGFVMIKDRGTREDTSQYISNVTFGNPIEITSPNHCLLDGDYIEIDGMIFAGASNVLNGAIYQITRIDNDNFYIDTFGSVPGAYVGNGVYRRLAAPFIQT
jgi:hypothetical protein